jgi:hypothetical protein
MLGEGGGLAILAIPTTKSIFLRRLQALAAVPIHRRRTRISLEPRDVIFSKQRPGRRLLPTGH